MKFYIYSIAIIFSFIPFIECIASDMKDLRDQFINIHYQRAIFPRHQDKFTGFIHTSCCEPFKQIQQAQKDLQRYPSLPSFNVEETEDGRCHLISNPNTQEKILMKIKLGQDGRERVMNTQDFPYSFHGHMIMEFANKAQYVGSGVLVGPNHVLTAAHNIYSHKMGEGWATKITFIPAHDENKQPFGQSQGTILLSTKEFISNQEEDQDLGMVILDEAIGYRTGWCGLFYVSDEILKDRKVHVTGYPGDKGKGNYRSTQMWTMGDKPKMLFTEKIEYEIDTYPGQSGSGIWTSFDSYKGYYVVGIHTNGIEQKINWGTRLSLAKIELILSWLDTYQFKNFIHPDLPSAKYNEKQKVFESYKEQAKKGDKESQYILGNYYYLGYQFMDDPYKAKTCWIFDEKAKKRIYYGIGQSQSEKSNYKKAFVYYEKAALQDHLEALWSLGECYELGRGVEENLTKSTTYYLKAAKKNYAPAQNSLGWMYQEGQGVAKNDVEAAEWFDKSAKQNNANAQNNLGVMYLNGQGVPRNDAKAVELIRKSAEQGYSFAQSNFGWIYINGRGVPKNKSEAKKWYSKAADQGDEYAKKVLASL